MFLLFDCSYVIFNIQNVCSISISGAQILMKRFMLILRACAILLFELLDFTTVLALAEQKWDIHFAIEEALFTTPPFSYAASSGELNALRIKMR